MNKFLKSLVAIAAVSVAFLLAPVVQAQECSFGQSAEHQTPGFFWSGLPEANFYGRVWVLGSSPLITNGTAVFFCTEDAPAESSNGPCRPDAGTSTDGRVVVSGNWGSAGVTACPNAEANGDAPNGALATSILGQGTPNHQGRYVLAAVGYGQDVNGYAFELTHPNLDGEVPARPISTPRISNFVVSGGTATATVSWDGASVNDDCSQTILPTCPPGSPRNALDGYHLYARFQSCSLPPTSGRTADWGSPIAPNSSPGNPLIPAGRTSETFNLPFDSSGANCTYVALGLVAGGPPDPAQAVSGHFLCSTADPDEDNVVECVDNCPTVANPNQANADNDRLGDACDGCPNDANKIQPGTCGCGVADTDSDGDGTADCVDGCPANPFKTSPGICGCNLADTDSDGDGTADCVDGCPADPAKTTGGICGCGVADIDTDGDGFADCVDTCPFDPNPNQSDTTACVQGCNAQISFTSSQGRGSGTVTWQTRNEKDLAGFNIVICKGGLQDAPPGLCPPLTCVGRTQLNDTVLRCEECTTDKDFPGYSFIVAKHKSGHNIFIEALHTNGTCSILCGPAVK